MRTSGRLAWWLAGWGGWVVWLWPSSVWTQQMSLGVPFHTVREGFFEHIGTQWALQGRDWLIQFGGADLARPTIGGFQPGAGIQGGFGFGGPGWTGQLQFSAAQGTSRSFSSVSPSVTVMNGATGYVADVSVSPFVIGLIPVVGGGGWSPWMGSVPGIRVAGPGGPPWAPVPGSSKVERFWAEGGFASGESRGISGDWVLATSPPTHGMQKQPLHDLASRPEGTPLRATSGANGLGKGAAAAPVGPSVGRLAEARQSSAGQAAPSVAEAQALREAELQQAHQEALQWFERGRQAEQAGNLRVAKIYYQMAVRRATGPLQQEILDRLQALASE